MGSALKVVLICVFLNAAAGYTDDGEPPLSERSNTGHTIQDEPSVVEDEVQEELPFVL